MDQKRIEALKREWESIVELCEISSEAFFGAEHFPEVFEALEESRLEADALRSAAERMGEEIRELREKGREIVGSTSTALGSCPELHQHKDCTNSPSDVCSKCWREYGAVFYREGDE
jgi:hypothetical protein